MATTVNNCWEWLGSCFVTAGKYWYWQMLTIIDDGSYWLMLNNTAESWLIIWLLIGWFWPRNGTNQQPQVIRSWCPMQNLWDHQVVSHRHPGLAGPLKHQVVEFPPVAVAASCIWGGARYGWPGHFKVQVSGGFPTTMMLYSVDPPLLEAHSYCWWVFACS